MTARWRTREELIHQVVILTTQGMSGRSIMRALGVSRNTIKKILRQREVERDTGHTTLPKTPERAPRATVVHAPNPLCTAKSGRIAAWRRHGDGPSIRKRLSAA